MIVFDQLKKNDPPLRVLTLVVLAGLLILVGGLWWVQVIMFHTYTESGRSQSYRTVRIPAVRGKILDRNGHVLAENRPSYDINLYIEDLRSEFAEEFNHLRPRKKPTKQPAVWKRWMGIKSPETVPVSLSSSQRAQLNRQARFAVASRVVNEVSKIIGAPIELDEKAFHKYYVGLRALPLTIYSNLQTNRLARFLESPSIPPSIDLETRPMRYYPNGNVAAHLLGYLGKDVSSQAGELSSFNYRLRDYKGKIGLEGVFDADLRGRAGVKTVLVNNMGYRQTESIREPAEAGKDIVLTIDLPIQQAAEQALYDQVKNVRGAVVVMDANNGDVYALVSAPAFDPNQFIPFITQSEMDVLNDKETYALVNRATMGQYHPGSIFKIMTALACLESGVLNETNLTQPFYNPGFFKIGRTRINDEADAGNYDFERAFIKSSNTYFIHYGLMAGFSALQRTGLEFQFGQSMSLPTWQNEEGNFPTTTWLSNRGIYMSEGDTANLTIGQGYIDVTPMQIAVSIAAVANGGTIVQPRVVDRIVPQSEYGQPEPPEIFPYETRGKLNIKPKHLQLIRDVMRKDVGNSQPGPDQGTGHRAEVAGMDICAKTGTAENKAFSGGPVNRKDVWFASFAPKENARYVIIVMVEGGVFGGITAAPIAKKIYQAIQKREETSSFGRRNVASSQ